MVAILFRFLVLRAVLRSASFASKWNHSKHRILSNVMDGVAVRAILARPNSVASPRGCYATKLLGRGLSRNWSIRFRYT